MQAFLNFFWEPLNHPHQFLFLIKGIVNLFKVLKFEENQRLHFLLIVPFVQFLRSQNIFFLRMRVFLYFFWEPLNRPLQFLFLIKVIVKLFKVLKFKENQRLHLLFLDTFVQFLRSQNIFFLCMQAFLNFFWEPLNRPLQFLFLIKGIVNLFKDVKFEESQRLLSLFIDFFV